MSGPFTPAQFRLLDAAFNCAPVRNITGAKWRTYDKLNSEGLLHIEERRVVLSNAGLRAYVDMCERRDADSGCIAYQKRAQEAREALAARQVRA